MVAAPQRRGPGRPRKQPLPVEPLTSLAPLGAPMPAVRMVAVLKCHAEGGANVANLVLYSDGRVVPHGEVSLLMSALRQIAKRTGA